MTTEWDDTVWAGTPVATSDATKALRPWRPPFIKAVTGAGVPAYANDYPLSSLREDPQQRAEAFLKAYKCGWFYKAESRISGDLARQPWTVTDGDIESEDPEETKLPRPDLDIPFESLDPIEQFMRLMERPNPSQTGRQLRQKTFIRRDMAGWTFWYLEAASPASLPTAIYGISPARLWPSFDRRTGKLLGYVLDANRGGTMTFEPWEIVAFSNASADDDEIYGVGVVEAVYAELPLTDLMSRHTADLLSTGGRLAGFMWPKERALDEDEFTDAQRAWRNVVSDANSARRLLLFPEPMEWSAGASTPAEIGIPELAGLNRENILTAFPIDPTMLGVPMPSGLNASGSTRQELQNAYWSGTIEPRSQSFDEVLQVRILSRYEAVMGRTFRYQTDLPDLDDASSLLEKAGAFKSLVSIGFEPKAIIKAVGLDHIKWMGIPEPVVAEDAEGAAAGPKVRVEDPSRDNVDVSQELSTGKATKSRAEVVEEHDPRIRQFLRDQADRVTSAIAETMPRTKALRTDWSAKADPDWWDKAQEDKLLREALSTLYVEAAKGSLQVVADTLERIVPNRAVGRVVDDLVTQGGERIVGINDTTKTAVQDSLAEGTRRGYSLNQLIDGVPGEGFTGVRELSVFDEARAETIARTETMLSYNRAALDAYGEFGVREVLAYDGDADPECAARDGRTFSVEDALSIADHPNGTLDWAPVTDKALTDRSYELAMKAIEAASARPVINNYIESARSDSPDMLKTVEEITRNMQPVINASSVEFPVTIDTESFTLAVRDIETAIRAQPAPIVNVPPNPPAQIVVTPAKAQDVQDVRIVDDVSPPKVKRVVRGKPTRQYPAGPIQGVVEE